MKASRAGASSSPVSARKNKGMSTILNTNGATLSVPRAVRPDFRFAIVTADWNPDITHALRDGAAGVFAEGGVPAERVDLFCVPGTVELVNIAAALINRKTYDGIVAIGCVIRGDTPHFDYVCQQAAQGAAFLNARGETPVIFGVLTVDNLDQALQRAGGSLGNKGAEAACAAIEMANIHASL